MIFCIYVGPEDRVNGAKVHIIYIYSIISPIFFIPIFAGIRHSDSPMRCGVGVEMMVRVELWVDVGVGMMAWVELWVGVGVGMIVWVEVCVGVGMGMMVRVELCVGVGVGLMVWNVVWVGVGEGLMVRA